MNNPRAHAESAIRQLKKLGMTSSHIDPVEIEALENLRAAAKQAPATKADIEEINRRLSAIERALREPRQYTFTNAIASDRQMMRGVFAK